MCVFFSHKKGSKKTGLTPTSNFPGGPLEEAQTRVPTCHICHVCHICLCHVGFSNFTEVLAQSCCKTFKASKSSKYSKRYFQQRLPWFRWYADIRRYAHAQHLLTAVDLTCFLVSGPTESRLLSSVSGRCIGALVGHQTLQEAFGGCRSDSSVWPGVPPLVRHSDQTCLKHEWIRTNEHGFRSATRNREKIFRFLWICISLSLFGFVLPSHCHEILFCLPPLQAPCFSHTGCERSRNSFPQTFVVGWNDETRMKFTMKRSRCHNADNAICQGYLSHLGDKWALLTSRTTARDTIPNRQASNIESQKDKGSRQASFLCTYAVRSNRFVTIWKNIKIGPNGSHDSVWSIVPPSDLPTISVNSTWRSIILLDMSCAQQKGVAGLRFQT